MRNSIKPNFSRVKVNLIRIVQYLANRFGMVSRTSSLKMGNNIGEEFLFLKRFSNQLFQKSRITYVDIGANLGDHFLTTSKVLSEFVEVEKALLIEAIPNFVKELKNKFGSREDVQIIESFVGRSRGKTARIWQVGNGGRSFHVPFNSLIKEVRGFEVEIQDLDECLGKLNIRPDFIKLDVDGSEYDVLLSSTRSLEFSHPVLIWEYSFDFAREAGVTLKMITSLLSSSGYKNYVIDSSGHPKKVRFARLEVIEGQTKNFVSVQDACPDFVA